MQETERSAKRRVLIVDDEWLDLEGLRDQMPLDLYPELTVETAKHAKEALGKFHAAPFEILFTDIRMPGMTGLELAQIVRSRWPATAIVVVSGFDEFEYARRAITVDAAYYLLKPVEDGELQRAIEAALRRVNANGTPLAAGPPAEDLPAPPLGISERVAQRVARIVHERIVDDLSLRGIAEELQYTPNHLGRLFQEATGRRFSDYLKEQRMDRAMSLLQRMPELRVSEVAARVGYRDPDAFSRQFRDAFGVLPKSFREADDR